MSATYKAVEVSKPGQFSLVQKPLLDPGLNQVRIKDDLNFIDVTKTQIMLSEEKLF